MADRKMDTAASLLAIINHAFIPPVEPGFIGVFYWQKMVLSLQLSAITVRHYGHGK